MIVRAAPRALLTIVCRTVEIKKTKAWRVLYRVPIPYKNDVGTLAEFTFCYASKGECTIVVNE